MAGAKPIARYRITDHARSEMMRRQIIEEDVAKVLIDPEQVETFREGREVYQRRYQWGSLPRTYLLRVFVDVNRTPPEVVTAYRTSKITKYWSTHNESNLQS
jgi:hypothetical protein